jgi:hypothetical protein
MQTKLTSKYRVFSTIDMDLAVKVIPDCYGTVSELSDIINTVSFQSKCV